MYIPVGENLTHLLMEEFSLENQRSGAIAISKWKGKG
jgi:hypothetical protein